MAPFCLRAINIAVSNRPIKAHNSPDICVHPEVALKSTSVAGLSTTHPASSMPIIARNRPMPAIVAIFKSLGMAFIIAARAPVLASPKNSNPSTNTAARATSQGIPIPRHTPYKKYAFSPIPGARANGRFAQRPIIKHATHAATAVANRASLNGIPVSKSINVMSEPDIIFGFTIRM